MAKRFLAVLLSVTVATGASAQVQQLANWGRGNPCHAALGPGRCTVYGEWRSERNGVITVYRADGRVFRKHDEGAEVDSALYADPDEEAAARRVADEALEADLPR
jgi:hypothetical protein